jgi:predicted DNA-binding transcriptional regulator AlpA
MESDLYTAADILEKFDISEQTLHNWRKKNNFPHPIKIGRRIFWRKGKGGGS